MQLIAVLCASILSNFTVGWVIEKSLRTADLVSFLANFQLLSDRVNSYEKFAPEILPYYLSSILAVIVFSAIHVVLLTKTSKSDRAAPVEIDGFAVLVTFLWLYWLYMLPLFYLWKALQAVYLRFRLL